MVAGAYLNTTYFTIIAALETTVPETHFTVIAALYSKGTRIDPGNPPQDCLPVGCQPLADLEMVAAPVASLEQDDAPIGSLDRDDAPIAVLQCRIIK